MRTCPICHRIPCQYAGCPHKARHDRRMCWSHAADEDAEFPARNSLRGRTLVRNTDRGAR